MNFSNLAYAKLNLDFDHSLFAKEFDEQILPDSRPIANGLSSILETVELNKSWGMIDPELYCSSDYYKQSTDATTTQYIKSQRPAWQMTQLMELDTTGITDPLLLRWAAAGGVNLRNETLGYNYNLKLKYKELNLIKWIYNTLPFESISWIHCVSIEPGGMSTIHRDEKGMYRVGKSSGVNKVYKSGHVIVCLNITNGGVPLYWSLDGADAVNYKLADDPVYLANDYFLHGVPIVSSRRRQIRITGIPNLKMFDLFDKESIISINEDYAYDPSWPDPKRPRS